MSTYAKLMRDPSVAPCVRIAAAKLILGARYVLHPANKVTRLAQPLRDVSEPTVLRRA